MAGVQVSPSFLNPPLKCFEITSSGGSEIKLCEGAPLPKKSLIVRNVARLGMTRPKGKRIRVQELMDKAGLPSNSVIARSISRLRSNSSAIA